MTVISASRRTDLPAFYAPWLENRLRAGYCTVPNPFNPRQVATVSLLPADVAAIVFWTRDPSRSDRLLDLLDQLAIPSLFLVTVTGYGPPLEPYAPTAARASAACHRLAARLGPARVVWRYDPIVLGPGLAPDDHRRRFAELAARLEGATDTVKVSFVDLYRKSTRRMGALPGGAAWLEDPATLAAAGPLVADLAAIAARAGMTLETCAEPVDWGAWGARPGRCIDPARLNRLFGLALPTVKDRGQRPACGCAPSRDIGMNDSCRFGCAYCYATTSDERAAERQRAHDPSGQSLIPAGL